MKEKISEKHKEHQVYKTKSGLIVPGGSTIAGMLDKSGPMVGSAVKLTKLGFDYKKVWNEKAEVGTVAHGIILSELTGEPFDLNDYSQTVIDQARWAMKSYYKWKSEHKINPIKCEVQFVSEVLKSGGTFDFYGEVDGHLDLQDYKTGGLYESAYIQIAGYGMIGEECGLKIDRLNLLNIPRTQDDEFKSIYLTDKQRKYYGKIYKNLCEIYWDRKEVKEDK